MKRFTDVEATRRRYHADEKVNSVHRSSLLVPELPGATAEISFLNHFLLKRGHREVACRITAVDPTGEAIESRLVTVSEPRVYAMTLTGSFGMDVATYHVEFFSARNLVMPFPAVMVNHRGPDFLNTVHAYNRVLNDVFEHDAINATSVAEAAIDVVVGDDIDTFLVFAAGPIACDGELMLELGTLDRKETAVVPVRAPRFTHQMISLRSVFPHVKAGAPHVLKVRQPRQLLFYGRLLAGQRTTGGAFSANHSYYDNSSFPEYWPDRRCSSRTYPYFSSFESSVRMYPIMSPGRLVLTLELHGRRGESLASAPLGELASPGGGALEASVGAIARSAGIPDDEVVAFTLSADGPKIPTRVNHQLVNHSGSLASSINVSLDNPNVFVSDGREGLTWGQLPAGRLLDSRLGLVTKTPTGEPADVECTIYGERGEIGRVSRRLVPGAAVVLTAEDVGGREELEAATPRYLWFMARSRRPDVSAFVLTRHRQSGCCTGDHTF